MSSLTLQMPTVRIAVLPMMDVKTLWNSTRGLLERDFRLREFTRGLLKNTKYSDYQSLFTIQDERTIMKYVIEVMRPFQYWTLWMSKWHTVTLYHFITVYNDMFDYMDDMMRVLAKKKTPGKEEIFFAMKFAGQKLSTYYAEVTPLTGMLLMSALC